jgi:hypothetical protein
VRPGLHYDYNRQFKRYILPKFADTPVLAVNLALLEAFRLYLNQEMGLSLKSCRNIIDGTFRAMMRDARKHGLSEKDYFADLEWPRLTTAKPDPFTGEERDIILAQFKTKHPFYYPFVFTQFWTGMRPSEAIALRWSDVDLKIGTISITKSRYMETDSPTKTQLVSVRLGLMNPLWRCLDQSSLCMLRKTTLCSRIRKVDLYGKTNGAGSIGIEHYGSAEYGQESFTLPVTHLSLMDYRTDLTLSGWQSIAVPSVAMIEKHYGKYISSNSEEQLKKLFGAKTETFTETLYRGHVSKRRQIPGILTGSEWSGRVDSNHRPHGPEPCALPS